MISVFIRLINSSPRKPPNSFTFFSLSRSNPPLLHDDSLGWAHDQPKKSVNISIFRWLVRTWDGFQQQVHAVINQIERINKIITQIVIVRLWVTASPKVQRMGTQPPENNCARTRFRHPTIFLQVGLRPAQLKSFIFLMSHSHILH